MKKNVNPMATCHDVGACLLHAQCPCAGPCVKVASSAPAPFAPGVIDGPYVRRQRRTERLARAMLVAACLLAMVVPLGQLARLAGWF